MKIIPSSQQIAIDRKKINSLPNLYGVYLFKTRDNQINYIGKSRSLRSRLLSHLDSSKLGGKERLIVINSSFIEYIITDSEFKALLLESSLIQKYHPKYNNRWRDDKSYLYIKITHKDNFPKVFAVRKKEIVDQSLYFGPFPSQKDVRQVLTTIRKIFPFCSQKKISSQPCFYSKIGQCHPCPNEIIKVKNKILQKKLQRSYLNNINNVINALKGETDLVLKNAYKKLKQLAQDQKYELAIQLRDKISRFQQLIYQKQFSADIESEYNQSQLSLTALLKLLQTYYPHLKNLKRIEGFDISNLFLKDAAASVIVFTDGLPDKSQYRRFRIKNRLLRSDTAMLEEVLKRRFSKNWAMPNLIIIDGGTPQLLKIREIFSKLKINLPLIGIAKHPDRLVLSLPHQLKTLKPPNNHLGFNLIRNIRDESHRFARKYHLILRDKKIMPIS